MLNWLALMVGVKGATLDFYCEVMQLSSRLRNEKEQVGKFGSGVKKKKNADVKSRQQPALVQ